MSQCPLGQVRLSHGYLSRSLVRHHVRYLGPYHAAVSSYVLDGRTARKLLAPPKAA